MGRTFTRLEKEDKNFLLRVMRSAPQMCLVSVAAAGEFVGSRPIDHELVAVEDVCVVGEPAPVARQSYAHWTALRDRKLRRTVDLVLHREVWSMVSTPVAERQGDIDRGVQLGQIAVACRVRHEGQSLAPYASWLVSPT